MTGPRELITRERRRTFFRAKSSFTRMLPVARFGTSMMCGKSVLPIRMSRRRKSVLPGEKMSMKDVASITSQAPSSPAAAAFLRARKSWYEGISPLTSRLPESTQIFGFG